MRAGPLDVRILIHRKSVGHSPSGEPIEVWNALGGPRWSSRAPVSGAERFTAVQFAALEQVEFRLRWSSDIDDLQPLDRIIEPASDGNSPPIRSIYDIIAVHEIGRHDALRVFTTRRADVPA
jgi:head-tail adaptor